MRMPSTASTQATVKPMNSEVRVPDQMRAQMSWPMLLVPKMKPSCPGRRLESVRPVSL